MSYLANYNYTSDGETIERDNCACFSSLFCSIERGTNISDLTIFMWKKCNFSEHKLVFLKEDLVYVLEKFEKLIPTYEVVDISDKKKGDGIKVTFLFDNSPIVLIKFVCILCRYFYEKQDYSEYSYVDIMRASIDFHKLNPEESFIEILQFMHYNVDSGGGHSMVAVCEKCMLDVIISEQTFLKRIINKNNIRVYSSGHNGNAVFDGQKLLKMQKTDQEYLTIFKQYPRI